MSTPTHTLIIVGRKKLLNLPLYTHYNLSLSCLTNLIFFCQQVHPSAPAQFHPSSSGSLYSEPLYAHPPPGSRAVLTLAPPFSPPPPLPPLPNVGYSRPSDSPSLYGTLPRNFFQQVGQCVPSRVDKEWQFNNGLAHFRAPHDAGASWTCIRTSMPRSGSALQSLRSLFPNSLKTKRGPTR